MLKTISAKLYLEKYNGADRDKLQKIYDTPDPSLIETVRDLWFFLNRYRKVEIRKNATSYFGASDFKVLDKARSIPDRKAPIKEVIDFCEKELAESKKALSCEIPQKAPTTLTEDYDTWDDREERFEQIKYCSDPSQIETVAELRHYINIWGLNKKLKAHFPNAPLNEIRENFSGKISITKAISNFESINAEAKKKKAEKRAKEKQQKELIKQIPEARKEYCGLGTRKVKLLLNRLSKTSPLAKAYRLALETEDLNIQAKANLYYADKIYSKKGRKILELAGLCKQEGYPYGYQDSPNTVWIAHVVYFDLPNCEQISFHADLDKWYLKDFPKYEGEWDGKINSTLGKLEAGILKTFPNEISNLSDNAEPR